MGAQDDDDGQVAGTRLGDYTLRRRLGRGGQGEVYEARQESLGRSVALKILASHLSLNEERLQRFRREAEAGARLAHPNIVVVHAVGEDDGTRYIAQELVEGGRTLADEVDEARRLPELPRGWYERMAGLFAQVASALHVAHEAGVIHRDVKPGNILLTKDGSPKVADFGLALVEDDLLRSRSGELVGTPFYMSPEQVAARRIGIDRRTDVFSLGSTLYEALTLRRPFDGDSRERIVQAILLHEPAEPRKVRGRVPRDLAVICMKALEKRPERRYATAAELADDLRRHLAGEPILAKPPGALVRAGKWMRRHPLRVGATLIVALAAGLFTSWLVAMAHAKSEADAALASAQRADRSRQRVIEIIGDFADATGFDGSEETIRNVAIRLRSLLPTLPEPSGEGDDVSWYVRMIAGTNFLRIGDHAEAEVLLERALAMARAVRDDAEQNQQANIAQSAFQLGRLRRETGEYTEAEALFLEAIERYGRVLDPGASEINDVEGQLARLYAAMGRRDDAEAHYRRFLEGARGQAGPQVIDAQGALGEFLLIQGRLDEAAAHLLAAWQSVGTTTPPVTRLMLGRLLGWLHAERARRAAGGGRREEAATEAAAADRMFEETLAGQRSYFGTSHEQLARTLVAYGSFLRSQGRYGEARTVLDEAVSMAAATVGPHDELTLASLNSLAALLYDEEETESAEATWRGIVADGQVSNSVTSVAVPTALRNLAVLCLKQGRRDEARAFAEALLARTPPDHPDLSRRRELLDRIEAAAAARTDEP